MCRFQDKGNYELGNIFIATHEENSREKFVNGFKGKPRAISDEVIDTVKAMLEMKIPTRKIAHLVNCSQKQVMNFKNQKLKE